MNGIKCFVNRLKNIILWVKIVYSEIEVAVYGGFSV